MQIIGHRGSMATHPENTLEGFRHAIAVGADGVELDVAITRDNVLVVTHDLILRGTGQVVRECRAADLGLPTLDDVLAIDAPAMFWFEIDAKADERAPETALFARLLSEALGRRRTGCNVRVRSFEHSILRALHAMRPEIPLAALAPPKWPEDWMATARAADASTIAAHYSTATLERVESAHAAGIAVNVWTVNDPEDWERLASMGVVAVVTDDPGPAVLWRDRRTKLPVPPR